MRRYASNNTIPGSALYAWQELGNSVYRDNPSRFGSLILHRPEFGRSQTVGSSI